MTIKLLIASSKPCSSSHPFSNHVQCLNTNLLVRDLRKFHKYLGDKKYYSIMVEQVNSLKEVQQSRAFKISQSVFMFSVVNRIL